MMEKNENLVQFSISLPEDLLIRIEEIATNLHIYRTSVIRLMLETMFRLIDEGKVKVGEIFRWDDDV